jgi:hypothetical protein
MVVMLPRIASTQLPLHGELVALVGAARDALGLVHADPQRLPALFAGVEDSHRRRTGLSQSFGGCGRFTHAIHANSTRMM